MRPKQAGRTGPKMNELGEMDFSAYHLTARLGEDLASLKGIFDGDDTAHFREFENGRLGLRCAVLFLDGMMDQERVNQHVIRPVVEFPGTWDGLITAEEISRRIITGSEVTCEGEYGEMVKAALYGDTVLLVDGLAQALVIGSKGFAMRMVTEPDSEKALKGPREGFTENIMTNLSLLRRKLQTVDLKCSLSSMGTRSGTRIGICYLDSLVDQAVLAEVKARLQKMSIDGVLDSNYIIESIQDHRYSPFKTIGTTEKPDIVAANLLEGRVAIFVDGTPMVLTMPFLFIENFQSPDDYYQNYVFASINRFLRVIGFWLTISVPAIYIALVNFHQEIIPSPLMLTIASATEGVPFPTAMECVGMLILFEVLRESGIRSSNKIGQALSIVGGLVVGQAAVEAKIVSAPMVIVVALTGITGMIIPRLSGATMVLRFASIFMACMGGILGYYFVMLAMWIHVLSLESFGYPYVRDLSHTRGQYRNDAGIRAPIGLLKKRPDFAADRRRR